MEPFLVDTTFHFVLNDVSKVSSSPKTTYCIRRCMQTKISVNTILLFLSGLLVMKLLYSVSAWKKTHSFNMTRKHSFLYSTHTVIEFPQCSPPEVYQWWTWHSSNMDNVNVLWWWPVNFLMLTHLRAIEYCHLTIDIQGWDI